MSCEYDRLHQGIESYVLRISQRRDRVKKIEEFEVLAIQVREAVERAQQCGSHVNTSRKSSSISNEIKKIEAQLSKNAEVSERCFSITLLLL